MPSLKEKIEQYSIPEPNTGCWLWFGAWKGNTKLKSYGNVMYKGKNIAAHRLSYTAHYGEIPTDKWILHKCDTPSCVNPEHLFLGDRQLNAADRKAKNRGLLDNGKKSGEQHLRASTTWEVVRKIRTEYKKNVVTAPMLAKKYGLGVSAVELIVLNYTWKEK